MAKKKLTKEELTSVQTMLNAFNQLKMQLGDAELQKASIIKQIETLKKDYANIEKKLADKYGEDVSVDVKSGEIKKKELEKVD